MTWFRAKGLVPAALTTALTPGEQLSAVTPTCEGLTVAASRFGLWVVDGETVERWDWHLVSRARWANKELTITLADEVGQWADGTSMLCDRPDVVLRPTSMTKLTDIVHQRVRRSVAASRHVPWPGAGGWVVLRRVPGRDGLTVQVRLDMGADPRADGFADAVRDAVNDLWPPEVPRPGDVVEDE